MNTEQTAQQFELAAQLIRTGHPWKSYPQAPDTDIYSALRDGFEIRPVLATPPDNRPIHNPDNLTAEQVGVGYRLLCAEDGVPSGKVDTWMFGGWCSAYAVDKQHLHECDKTYRLPLSVPWPEAKPDPYAELKKAHAEGKVIQFVDDGDIWRDIDKPNWKLPVRDYRIKPTPPFQLPPPPLGKSEPEYIRVPDACRRFSLSRSWLYERLDEGVIKTVSLKKEGMVRGKRLINLVSLREYIENF
jgi:hypothetical protein